MARGTPGLAQRDPALEVERIAKALGTPADISAAPGYPPAFRGTTPPRSSASALFGIAR